MKTRKEEGTDTEELKNTNVQQSYVLLVGQGRHKRPKDGQRRWAENNNNMCILRINNITKTKRNWNKYVG